MRQRLHQNRKEPEIFRFVLKKTRRLIGKPIPADIVVPERSTLENFILNILERLDLVRGHTAWIVPGNG